MNKPPFEAIIFDLGNVVIDYSFDRAFAAWGRIFDRDPDELKRRFVFGDRFEDLERGDLSDSEYIAHVSRMLDLEFTRESFDAGWNDIYLGLKPGVIELISGYRAAYRTIALTNTNPLHAPVWRERVGETLQSVFERIFASHEIRTRKPEPGAYRLALDYLVLRPDQVVFVDDNPQFIKGAEDLGIRSVLASTRDDIDLGLQEALK